MRTNTLQEKIKKIEKDLGELKLSLQAPQSKTTELLGLWKEIQITEKDIEEAKKTFNKSSDSQLL